MKVNQLVSNKNQIFLIQSSYFSHHAYSPKSSN